MICLDEYYHRIERKIDNFLSTIHATWQPNIKLSENGYYSPLDLVNRFEICNMCVNVAVWVTVE